MPERAVFKAYQFSLIICRNPKTGLYLAVNETDNRGWWIPGGGVDAGETFREGALRECLEEAGVDVELKGIIKIDHWMNKQNDSGKMRVIYYAEPKDVDVVPKQEADSESLEAQWVSLEDFPNLGKIRGEELLVFGGYVEAGGPIHPMSMMNDG